MSQNYWHSADFKQVAPKPGKILQENEPNSTDNFTKKQALIFGKNGL